MGDCDVCAGTGKDLRGDTCICGGTGMAKDAVVYLRRKLFDARSTLESLLKESKWGKEELLRKTEWNNIAPSMKNSSDSLEMLERIRYIIKTHRGDTELQQIRNRDAKKY